MSKPFLLSTLLLMFWSVSAGAKTFEVSTVNELKAAFDEASVNDEEDVIRIISPSLEITETVYFTSDESKSMTIIGSDERTRIGLKSFDNGASWNSFTGLIFQAPSAEITISSVDFANLTELAVQNSAISSQAQMDLDDVTAVGFADFVTLTDNNDLRATRISASGNLRVFSLPNRTRQTISISQSTFTDNQTVVLTTSGNGGQNVTLNSSIVNCPIVEGEGNAGTAVQMRYGSDLTVSDVEIRNCKDAFISPYNVVPVIKRSKFYDVENILRGSLGYDWLLSDNLIVGSHTVVSQERYLGASVSLVNNTIVDATTLLEISSLESFSRDGALTITNNLIVNVETIASGPGGDYRPTVKGETNGINLLSPESVFVDSVNRLERSLELSEEEVAELVASNYVPSERSRLVDSGTVTNVVGELDLVLQNRVLGGSVDIGAYEYASSSPTLLSFDVSGELRVGSVITFSFEIDPADVEAGVTTYFDFGDGEEQIAEGGEYVFDTPGSYTVKLIVVNEEGARSSRSLSFDIRDLTLEEKLDAAEQAGRDSVINDPAFYGLLTTETLTTELESAVQNAYEAVKNDPTAFGIDIGFDIDGDGESKALTDGLLLIRYLFGFTGDSLISGAIEEGAERDTAEAVEAYIQERIPVQ